MIWNEVLMTATFRSFQGINLHSPIGFPIGSFHMRGHIADPDSPFGSRIREIQAKFTGWNFHDFLAAFTLLNNLVTAPSIKLTPAFFHKKALHTLFYRCTNHGYHILSCLLKKNHAPQNLHDEERGVDYVPLKKFKRVLCLKNKLLSSKNDTEVQKYKKLLKPFSKLNK
jgi:hypothetical protein